MKTGEPIDRRIPWVRRLHQLDEARSLRSAGVQLKALRGAAKELGDALRAGPKVEAVKTIPLTTLLYPTSFAFNRAVPLRGAGRADLSSAECRVKDHKGVQYPEVSGVRGL